MKTLRNPLQIVGICIAIGVSTGAFQPWLAIIAALTIMIGEEQ